MPVPVPGWVRALCASLVLSLFLVPGSVAGATAPVELPPQEVAPGEVTLELILRLPPGWQLTPDAPQSVRLTSQNPAVVALTPLAAAALGRTRFPLHLPLLARPGNTTLSLDLLFNLCRQDQTGMCLIRESRLRLPVTVAEGASSRTLRAVLELNLPGVGLP